jgi:cholesterol oxidase
VAAEHWDVIVIGSGFGGSVMAYRLAEAGLRVCVLERGKPYPPNSFPRAPFEARHAFWDPSAGLYGMFNVWSFKKSGAIVASGLGGGSLIYANVLIRKDERWFVTEDPKTGVEPWPVSRADLDPHYARVERMMNVQKYPLEHAPYSTTPKTLAFREAAQNLGREWIPLNLAVSFRPREVIDPNHPDDQGNLPMVGEPIFEVHRNLHDKTRYTCRLCGECDIGCNYGSKNTLDFNYLSEAKRLGAVLRTLCEVKTFAPRGPGIGFTVSYVQHDLEQATHSTPIAITADRLVLAAGTFGTTYLLLKNREAFPGLSPALGTRYSNNGDLLGFLLRARRQVNGNYVPRTLRPHFGPVITGAIRYPDELDGSGEAGRGFYVEEGGNPYLLSWMAELTGIAGYIRRLLGLLKVNVKYALGLSQDADLGAEIAHLIGKTTASETSLPLLAMGRDYPDGRLFLRGKYLGCDWSIRGSKEYYQRLRRELRRLAEVLYAEYEDNPSFKWNFQKVLTAHPLGGCPMAARQDRGIVNSEGEVFGFAGMYIADGSILPGPVGPNPSLTIAALADRFADRILAQRPTAPASS